MIKKIKKAIDMLVSEDIRTEGKVTNAIIAAMCFLGIVLIAIICAWFKLG